MIDVATALYNIMHAVYGEDVRQSLHDGLYQVNENSLEAVAKAIGIAIDSTITSTTSSSTGYVTGALVLNNVSWDFWKCTGTNTWALQGNIKGAPGEQGEPGEPGEDGTPGSIFHKGTGITGTSETPTIFSGSGVALANVTDVYLNTATGILYQCTTGGIATVAEWIWLMTFGEAGAVVWSTLAGKPFGTVGTSGLKIATDVLDVDLLKIERKASTLTSKATVVLTDEMVITDSADSSITKRSPLSALKTLFQSHFVTIDTEQTISTPKAFAQGIIAYGKKVGALPTGLGAYVTAYVDATHGARLLSYDGVNYQPLKMGAVVSLINSIFGFHINADGTVGIGSSLKRWNGTAWVADKLTSVNTSIAITDFATYTPSGTVETDLATAGYDYKVHKALTGVTADHVANVVFGAVEADSGNYASVVTTEAGYVNIYAKAVPLGTITIPTIDCNYKGV